MAKAKIRDRAYQARLALEKSDMSLNGIRAAHHLIHGDGGSINSDLLYGLFEIIDDAISGIRQAHELADDVLREAQDLVESNNGGR